MKGTGITFVEASAGSGKTYRLTREVTSAIAGQGAERVDLSGLVAVTFTKKAHVELESRIRQALVEASAFEEAMRMPFAYIGTVHACALHLLQEFALDAGLSPSVDVIVGHETKLLRQVFERSLDESVRTRLDTLANRLELRLDSKVGRTDWVTPVAEIMELARSNRIAPEALLTMAESSSARLLALLPKVEPDGDPIDASLARALDDAAAALECAKDETKKTEDAVQLIRESKRRLRDGELLWSWWVKLSKIEPAKACRPWVDELRGVASRYAAHPRLHEDIRETTRAIFHAASVGLAAYQAWKRARHVVDYVDMLDGALELLEHPRVRAELTRRLGLVVVDEFQDTSPIQLALFVQLHALAGRSVWVGDRKQCIFEYAGADPRLMDAVSDWISLEGGLRDRLGANHRSRPELVAAVSEVFASALARYGMAREEVVVEARRTRLDELGGLPPLGAWFLDSTNKDGDSRAIAEGLRRMLDVPHDTPVLDRTSGKVRPVRAGDIAVLVATNDAATKLADALHGSGVRVAIARAGLFETPEGVLTAAALRWLVDGHDRLAAATLDALFHWEGVDPDTWLAACLRDVRREASSVAASSPDAATEHQDGWRAALEAIRGRLALLAPSEVVDAVIAALDLAEVCARWPDPEQRVSNIDALRATAAGYEARCSQEREAATVAGLLRYFEALRTPTLRRDEMLPSDDQHTPSDGGALVVCTYHKAKGLEWPVVVMTELDRAERRDAFDVAPESSAASFNPDRPLAGRSIRYWPWPFGAQKTAPLADAAEASAEGQRVAEREEKERARLLYVGMTRARDHLVLAARSARGKTKSQWLDTLRNDNDEPIVVLPSSCADGDVGETELRLAKQRSVPIPTRVRRLSGERSSPDQKEVEPVWFERTGASGATTRAPFLIIPSDRSAHWPEIAPLVERASIGRVERLPRAIALQPVAYEDDVLGNAVHAFFAADRHGMTEPQRFEKAKALIEGFALTPLVSAESLVGAADALRGWVFQRWPEAIWHREVPVEATFGAPDGTRNARGVIDLLIETPDGYVLIDHKTFPAAVEAAWRKKCLAFAPQLVGYRWLLEALGGKRVLEAWIHLPVGGGMVEIAETR